MIGWTTHHSIVEFAGKWYLFYHDASRTLLNNIEHIGHFYTAGNPGRNELDENQ